MRHFRFLVKRKTRAEISHTERQNVLVCCSWRRKTVKVSGFVEDKARSRFHSRNKVRERSQSKKSIKSRKGDEKQILYGNVGGIFCGKFGSR